MEMDNQGPLQSGLTVMINTNLLSLTWLMMSFNILIRSTEQFLMLPIEPLVDNQWEGLEQRISQYIIRISLAPSSHLEDIITRMAVSGVIMLLICNKIVLLLYYPRKNKPGNCSSS